MIAHTVAMLIAAQAALNTNTAAAAAAAAASALAQPAKEAKG